MTDSKKSPNGTSERWPWDAVTDFLDRRDFRPMLMFLWLAAQRDDEFKELLIREVAGLKRDRRGTWSKVDHDAIALHYALAVLQGEPDPVEWVCGYVERIMKRPRPKPSTMDNEISRACRRADVASLPEWAQPIIKKRLDDGAVRHKRVVLAKGARIVRTR